MKAAIVLHPLVGKLVGYYLEGWRFGHLESVKNQTATIRPIAARGSAPCRTLRVPLADVKATDAPYRTLPLS